MPNEHENAYRRLPGPGEPTDGDVSAHGTAFSLNRFEMLPKIGERTRARTVAIRAAMTFFIVGVVVPCLSLALGTAQCIALAQWLPGERPPGECFERPALCFSLGLVISGISLGIHGFLWVLQLLWAHV